MKYLKDVGTRKILVLFVIFSIFLSGFIIIFNLKNDSNHLTDKNLLKNTYFNAEDECNRIYDVLTINSKNSDDFLKSFSLSVNNVVFQNYLGSISKSTHGCLTGETKIIMENGLEKDIKDIKKGEHVLSYDVEKKEKVISKVLNVEKTVVEGVFSINNGELFITKDHPVYVKKADSEVFTWASIDPVSSYAYYNNRFLRSLVEKDSIFCVNDELVEIKDIEYISRDVEVFTLSVDGSSHTFYANGFLVSNVHDYVVTNFKEGISKIYSDNYIILDYYKIQNFSEISYESLCELLDVSSKWDFRVTIKLWLNGYHSETYSTNDTTIPVYSSEVSASTRENVLIWDSVNEDYYYGWIRVEIFG